MLYYTSGRVCSMKVWLIRIIALIIMLLSAFIFWRILPPRGSVERDKIVSYCSGDATGDGASELLVVSGNGKLDSGERHGQFLLICDASAEDYIKSVGYIPPEKIRNSIDLTAIKPLKVQLGDVNGDGVKEVAVCVYKTAEFHPVMAKRPFFFDLVEGNLIPVWLGSRLSRPFDDYILYDIDADSSDEIIAVERLEDDRRVIAVYNWRGFGFEMLTQSEAFEGGLLFDVQKAGSEGINVFNSNSRERLKFNFRLNSDNLVCTVINDEEG